MNTILEYRQEIYDYSHSNSACQKYFYNSTHEEKFVAYYNSMYLLQDSTESLIQHRKRGFSKDPLLAYIEFWGVMQAVIIQQDSIAEIHEVIVGGTLDAKATNLKAWGDIRELRNVCAGHPARKDRPKTKPLTRTFMGRSFGDYNTVTYEQWRADIGRTHPKVRLGTLLDRYALEAGAQLDKVLKAMKARWT